MIVEEFCQLFAQTFVLLALVAEHHRMLEQLMLQLLRQFAPQVCGGGAEHQEITRRYVVDDLVRVPIHWRTHEIDTARSESRSRTKSRTMWRGVSAAVHSGRGAKPKQWVTTLFRSPPARGSSRRRVHLFPGKTRGRCIAAHDRLALFIRKHRIDIGKSVRCPLLYRVDDAFRSSRQDHMHDICGRRQS